MGIATSNAQDMVAAVLDSLDIRSYFGVVATACEVAAGKPGAGYLSEGGGRSGRTAGKMSGI